MENTNDAALPVPMDKMPGQKVCLITLVQPGLPDSVLRVGPSDHKEEKIWLDRRPGIERWESIKALMQRFCPRGKYVPEPAYYHPPTGKQEDLNISILKPEDIPYVQLDGAVLSAPPADERASRPHPEDSNKVAQTKISNLEAQVARLTTLVEVAVSQKQAPAPAPRKPGRPKKEVQP